MRINFKKSVLLSVILEVRDNKFPCLLLPMDMALRNSLIIKEEFRKGLIRILTLDIGCLPFVTIPREDGLVVLIVPVHLFSSSRYTRIH